MRIRITFLALATTSAQHRNAEGPWISEITPLAEGDFADPRSLSIDGSVFVSGTDYRRLLRFDGDLTNASRTEFATEVDFILGGIDYGKEVWAWTPYQHTDGSWHAYYTANAFEIMYARPDPPGQKWTAARPILRWKTMSKLVSAEGACYYDNRVQTDAAGRLYLITNHPSGPGAQGDVSILALPMASPGRMAANWSSRATVLLQPDTPKLNSERRDPGFVSITENTQIQVIRGAFVLFYSVGDYAKPNYKIGLAFSKSLLGPYSKIYLNDTGNVWNNSEPMREVRYLMQSSVPDWPGFMNRFLSGPGIASLVNTTSNGPALVFHARHPNNQGSRYLWKFDYLQLKPGSWDLDDAAGLGDLLILGGACAPPFNNTPGALRCHHPMNQASGPSAPTSG